MMNTSKVTSALRRAGFAAAVVVSSGMVKGHKSVLHSGFRVDQYGLVLHLSKVHMSRPEHTAEVEHMTKVYAAILERAGFQVVNKGQSLEVSEGQVN
jgi:hypothetical protein